MLRRKYLRGFIILLLLFHFCKHRNIFAHAGNDHSHETTPITIERQTYTHLKLILSAYLDVYNNLIKRELDSIAALAQSLLDAASKGVQTESEGSGRHMMDHILKGGQELRQAEDLQEIQEAFAIISDAMIPFFKSWPNQLKINKIKLYQCKEHARYWLQPQDFPPTCPYTSTKSTKCFDIGEVISK